MLSADSANSGIFTIPLTAKSWRFGVNPWGESAAKYDKTLKQKCLPSVRSAAASCRAAAWRRRGRVIGNKTVFGRIFERNFDN